MHVGRQDAFSSPPGDDASDEAVVKECSYTCWRIAAGSLGAWALGQAYMGPSPFLEAFLGFRASLD